VSVNHVWKSGRMFGNAFLPRLSVKYHSRSPSRDGSFGKGGLAMQNRCTAAAHTSIVEAYAVAASDAPAN
jgi:hypothetical protein